jgi:hypothetical protein
LTDSDLIGAYDVFPGDVKVMREAVSLSRRYHFSLEGLVKIGARMPCKMIRKVVSLAPHEMVLSWIEELLSEGRDLQVMAAIVLGLRDAGFDRCVNALLAVGLYSALQIVATDCEACISVLMEAMGNPNEDFDSVRRFIKSALKIAMPLCDRELTDLTVSFIGPDFVTDIGILDLVSRLFYEHKLRSISVTDGSAAFLVNVFTFGFNRSIMSDEVLWKIVESMIFGFEAFFPLLDDNFWVLYIDSVLSVDRVHGVNLL